MQINSNYSMNGVLYETRRKQDNIPQFSTECVVQENENINPYMEEVDFDEKAFDMIGPNAPQDVKDAWMEAAKDINANGMGIKKNGMLSHISQMMVQRLNKQLKFRHELKHTINIGDYIALKMRLKSIAKSDKNVDVSGQYRSGAHA